jgi:hypothetical protein
VKMATTETAILATIETTSATTTEGNKEKNARDFHERQKSHVFSSIYEEEFFLKQYV